MKDRFEELAEIWFKKAEDDLKWARYSLKGKFYGITCFGCQQIVEKSLKAYLFSRKEKLIRTHNLIKLLRLARKHDQVFKKLNSACEILSQYYTDTRYPDIWDYSRFDDKKLAKEAVKLAQKVLVFVKEKLKS